VLFSGNTIGTSARVYWPVRGGFAAPGAQRGAGGTAAPTRVPSGYEGHPHKPLAAWCGFPNNSAGLGDSQGEIFPQGDRIVRMPFFWFFLASPECTGCSDVGPEGRIRWGKHQKSAAPPRLVVRAGRIPERGFFKRSCLFYLGGGGTEVDAYSVAAVHQPFW